MLRNWLVHLIPCPCLLCGRENEQALCVDCVQQFFSQQAIRCVSCATKIAEGNRYCAKCLTDPPLFGRTITVCDYEAPQDQLIQALKFRQQLVVAPIFAQMLAKAMLRSNNVPDLIMPVPLSRQRLQERGFNQSLEIAKPLAKLLRRPLFAQLLRRVRDTTAQTLLHPDQRRDNILHAFSPSLRTADKIRGIHIGVVDDVMTTGATLNEIAACLKRHGAQHVTNLVFARTAPH